MQIKNQNTFIQSKEHLPGTDYQRLNKHSLTHLVIFLIKKALIHLIISTKRKD